MSGGVEVTCALHHQTLEIIKIIRPGQSCLLVIRAKKRNMESSVETVICCTDSLIVTHNNSRYR